MRVADRVCITLSNGFIQPQSPWGQEWYDAAKELASELGTGIVAVSVARRVQLGDGIWYDVTFDVDSQLWGFRKSA